MKGKNVAMAKVIPFRERHRKDERPRKSGLNRNKDGSVRNINGKVYVDFVYMEERVRESSGLPWNDENAKRVRQQLDAIAVSIRSGTFKFADVFPNSQKCDYFTQKEREGISTQLPDQIHFKDYAWIWYDLLKNSGRVSGRTLLGYKSYLNNYLIPYFGETTFADLDRGVFDKFVSWAKRQQLKKRPISNATANKILVPMKTICQDAAVEYGWGRSYNPFFGFKRLPEDDPYEQIWPFSLSEQMKVISKLSDHWQPYFQFAFRSGLRQGEQIGLKPEDIDWKKGLLHVRRAITRDENGKFIEGKTKNRYSRRTIKLTKAMFEPLMAQKKIYGRFGVEYFFCTTSGHRVRPSNLRKRVWLPALKKAECSIREMKQTRHSFATVALSCGENPLWIAKVMGHRNTEMVIKVYSRYIETQSGSNDGDLLDRAFQGTTNGDE